MIFNRNTIVFYIGVFEMRKAAFTITATHLFAPISALSKESNSYTATLRFKFHGTLQIKQSNFLISNNTFNQGT